MAKRPRAYGADDGIAELRDALKSKLRAENGLHGVEVMVTAGANQAGDDDDEDDDVGGGDDDDDGGGLPRGRRFAPAPAPGAPGAPGASGGR